MLRGFCAVLPSYITTVGPTSMSPRPALQERDDKQPQRAINLPADTVLQATNRAVCQTESRRERVFWSLTL